MGWWPIGRRLRVVCLWNDRMEWMLGKVKVSCCNCGGDGTVLGTYKTIGLHQAPLIVYKIQRVIWVRDKLVVWFLTKMLEIIFLFNGGRDEKSDLKMQVI